MVQTRSPLVEKIEAIATPVVTQNGMELVDLQFVHENGSWVLRFFLDKPGGITLDDCARMSQHIGEALEVADPIPQAYVLEISSPGLYRPLKTEADFAKHAGERVDIRLAEPLDGRRNYRGNLIGMEERFVVVDVDGRQYRLPFEGIAKARLDPDIPV